MLVLPTSPSVVSIGLGSTWGSGAYRMATAKTKRMLAIITYGITTLCAIVSSNCSFSAPLTVASFSLISLIPESNKVPKIKAPKAPATLLVIPIIDIRLAALSIGPKMVIYGLAAVCNKVIPAPCVKIPAKNNQ